MDVTAGLVAALVTTFLVIILGYVLGKVGILNSEGRKVVGALIVKLVLPCLILKAMATLDFGSVRWFLILGVALGKLAVLIIVIFVTMVASTFSYLSFAQGGLRGILSVQSNDFALGLPILSALYPMELTNYLYLFAPINFLMVYPISLFLLEYGTRKAGNRRNARLGFGLSIAVAIFKSPVVIATFLGVALNFAFNQHLPPTVEKPLTLVGSAFNALALLNLGASMVGKASQLKGPNLFKTLAVVFAKSVLLPILIALFLSLLKQRMITLPPAADDDDDGISMGPSNSWLPGNHGPWSNSTGVGGLGDGGHDDDDSMDDSYFLNLFGFIYGTFPSAPGALPFAQQYGVDIDLAASVVVVGTAVAAPLMFISAKMATITVSQSRVSSLRDLVSNAGINLSTVSIICGTLFLILYLLNRKYKCTTDKLHLLFAIACVGMGITANTCNVHTSTTGSDIRFSASWFFIFVTRVASIVIGMHLLMQTKSRGRRSWFSSSPFTITISTCLPLLAVGIVWLIEPTALPGTGINCSLLTGSASFYTALAVVSIGTAFHAAILIALGRTRSAPQARDLVSTPLGSERGSVSPPPLPLAVESDPPTDVIHIQESTGVSRGNGNDDDADDGSRPDDERVPLLSCNTDAVALGDTDEDEAASATEIPKLPPAGLRNMALLAYWALSCLIGTGSCLWVVTNGRASGIYYEVLFLDYALLNAQGFALFIALGTRGELFAVVGRMYACAGAHVRKMLYQTEVVPVLDIDEALHEFLDRPNMRQSLVLARDALLSTRAYRLRNYPNVLVGSEFVSYLVDTEIAVSRDHAATIGRALVAHGVLSHVTQEHHFHDRLYFYRWNEERFASLFPDYGAHAATTSTSPATHRSDRASINSMAQGAFNGSP